MKILQTPHKTSLFNLKEKTINSAFYNKGDHDYMCCVYNSLYLSGLFPKNKLIEQNKEEIHKQAWITAYINKKQQQSINPINSKTILTDDEIADSIKVPRSILNKVSKCVPFPMNEVFDYIKEKYPNFEANKLSCPYNTRNPTISNCQNEYNGFVSIIDTLITNSNSILILSFRGAPFYNGEPLLHMVIMHRSKKNILYIIDVIRKDVIYEIEDYFKQFPVQDIFIFLADNETTPEDLKQPQNQSPPSNTPPLKQSQNQSHPSNTPPLKRKKINP